MDNLNENINKINKELDNLSIYLDDFIEEVKNWKLITEIDLDELKRLKSNKTKSINEIKNNLKVDPDIININKLQIAFDGIIDFKQAIFDKYSAVNPKFREDIYNKHFIPVIDKINDFNEYIKNKPGYLIISGYDKEIKVECTKKDYISILNDRDKILPLLNSENIVVENYTIKDELGRLMLNDIEFDKTEDMAYQKSYETYFTYTEKDKQIEDKEIDENIL